MKVTREQLLELIKAKNWKAVENADVSEITDLHDMFFESKFNGDISNWDVSNVENMQCLFSGSKFNGDISNWNPIDCTTFDRMISNESYGNLKDGLLKDVLRIYRLERI